MVGGGAGIAPLYLGAKQYKAAGCTVDLYLGFSGAAFLTDAYQDCADRVTVKVGGFITDAIDPAGSGADTPYDALFTCGPEIMMRVLWEKCKACGVGGKLFVSLEAHMACGVGACYGCSRKTARGTSLHVAVGNKKVCKVGPVFPAQEVFDL
jgi:dihydroorotate dehydrogenase electron transfer subunit